jgi:transcriptional regulator with XRE-family HTH domain
VSRQKLDVPALYAALDLIRAHNELSWRDVAKATGISPSTFSRMADGHRPDADALCTLVAWLRVPLDRFTVDAETADAPSAHPGEPQGCDTTDLGVAEANRSAEPLETRSGGPA